MSPDTAKKGHAETGTHDIVQGLIHEFFEMLGDGEARFICLDLFTGMVSQNFPMYIFKIHKPNNVLWGTGPNETTTVTSSPKPQGPIKIHQLF